MGDNKIKINETGDQHREHFSSSYSFSEKKAEGRKNCLKFIFFIC
jgi:hypothetical protein